jgi:hypothetical protein
VSRPRRGGKEWVAAAAAELAPRSVLKYCQAIDYSGTNPNRAKHKTVKLPYADVEETTPPSTEHFLAILVGSLWHASGMPARELAERVGHSKASMSLDVNTHVMPPDEVQPEVMVLML